MLRDYGQLPLEDVLSYAIGYAENGYPVLPRMTSSILAIKDFFQTEWPTSAEQWLRNGDAPMPNQLFANPAIAQYVQAHSARKRIPAVIVREQCERRPQGFLSRIRGRRD